MKLTESLITEGSNINMNTRNYMTTKHHLKNSGPPGTFNTKITIKESCVETVGTMNTNQWSA